MLQSDWDGTIQKSDWDNIRNKALIVAHPLYPDLLMAHAACLRVGTPVDQLPHIEAQLSQAHNVTNKYSVLHPDQLDVGQDEKLALDRFMVNDIDIVLTSVKFNIIIRSLGDGNLLQEF